MCGHSLARASHLHREAEINIFSGPSLLHLVDDAAFGGDNKFRLPGSASRNLRSPSLSPHNQPGAGRPSVQLGDAPTPPALRVALPSTAPGFARENIFVKRCSYPCQSRSSRPVFFIKVAAQVLVYGPENDGFARAESGG